MRFDVNGVTPMKTSGGVSGCYRPSSSLRRAPLLILVAIIGWLSPGTLHAESPATGGEYQVKGAMIYKILSYVEWPADLFSSENSPLTICVLGSGPMESAIPLLNGQQQKGRPLMARKITYHEEAKKCNVMLINSSERPQLPALLDKIHPLPLLTISDLNGFSESGGIIELGKEGNRIRLEINLAAARQNRIKISSQLLKLARIVRGEK